MMSYFEKGIVILLEGKKLNISGFPDWAYYLIGAVFLMGGLISFYCFKKTQQKTKNYKKLQLKIFRSENRAKRKLSYKEAGLKLPIGWIIYQYLPIFIAITLLSIGITFIIRIIPDNNVL